MTTLVLASCHLVSYRVIKAGRIQNAVIGGNSVSWSDCRISRQEMTARSCTINSSSDVLVLRLIENDSNDRKLIHFYPTIFVLDPLGRTQMEISDDAMKTVGELSDKLLKVLHDLDWVLEPVFWGPIDFITINIGEESTEVIQ